MRIWDISPSLSEKTAVFPGDLPFHREVSLDLNLGHHLTLSSMRSTLHLGAHADASNHYHASGKGIDQRPLEPYLGNCQVIRIKLPRGERILPEHLNGMNITEPRVLFSTGSFPDPDCWNSDFNSLSPELIGHLAARGVKLVGIDTPSVDPADSKGLESHQAIFHHDLCVLEGLVLDAIPAGRYTLVALPLSLKDADASPVRAILLEPDKL